VKKVLQEKNCFFEKKKQKIFVSFPPWDVETSHFSYCSAGTQT